MARTDSVAPLPASPPLSDSQLEALGERGEEFTADVGEALYRVGDERYPFIAILEGEVAILDPGGHEIVRHGKSKFLGELSLLSGQTAFLSAVVTQPLRYIAVDRDALRSLLNEDGPLSDLLLSTFIARREALQRVQDVGVEIVGPRSSQATMRMLDFLRMNRLPFTWHEEADELDPSSLPLVRLPGGPELHAPSTGHVSRSLGIGRELGPREEADLLVVGAGPAGLGAAVYGASEGLDTLVIDASVVGGQAGSSRRIENYLGFPAGISGTELAGRAATQARKFNARLATPFRAESLEPGEDRHVVRLEEDHEIVARAVLLATGAQYRRLPVEDLAEYEGMSVFYAAGPPEAQLCGASRVAVVGGGNSAGQAAVWLARGGALVTLLHRRADLQETMSDYLIRELERYDVAVRDRSEISHLHGADGQLDGVTLTDGERLPVSFLFLFLGASPCTDWLGDVVARDDDGFILTGTAVNSDHLLETSVPGVFAAGDVRSGSTKRCATAVGEGAMAVQLVHARLAGGVPAGKYPAQSVRPRPAPPWPPPR
jgi:thioredoxin reductase (NADPH)